ncbi:quinone oxidoreductase family protein [Hoeflea sp.]|uniref:quinone oxidoreductase family protein n=1 Tax=Hoeflea sp. TaxID=1940281 RepID=UPI003A8DA56B
MHVIEQTSVGAPEVLQLTEAPMPVPGPGEVRIRVAAAGINPVDAMVRAGAIPLLGDPPFRVGWDAAGRIDALGEDVTGFAIGDRVMGLIRFPEQVGAYAQFINAPAAQLARIPDLMTDEAAGALPLAGLTAWQALVSHGRIKSGQKVFVHAGGGGVGHIAVQIAKAHGAEVWATASAGKIETVRSLGADHVIDYKEQDFAASGPFDLILDHAGGEHVGRSLDALKPGGHVTTLLDPGEEITARAEREGKTLVWMMVKPDAAGLTAMGELVRAGQLKVLIGGSFPLAQAAQAHQALARSPLGKIVLTV